MTGAAASRAQLKYWREKDAESEFARRMREAEEQADTTTRCAFCPWVFEGTAIDGRARSLAHRKRKHPDAVASTRKKPAKKKVAAEATADDRRVNAELETNRREKKGRNKTVKHSDRNETPNKSARDIAKRKEPVVDAGRAALDRMDSGEPQRMPPPAPREVRPPRPSSKIDDAKTRELHAEHLTGVTVNELGRRHWQQLGFKNPNSAQASMRMAFQRRGLEIVQRPARRAATVRVPPQLEQLKADLDQATDQLHAAQQRHSEALAALVVAAVTGLVEAAA